MGWMYAVTPGSRLDPKALSASPTGLRCWLLLLLLLLLVLWRRRPRSARIGGAAAAFCVAPHSNDDDDDDATVDGNGVFHRVCLANV